METAETLTVRTGRSVSWHSLTGTSVNLLMAGGPTSWHVAGLSVGVTTSDDSAPAVTTTTLREIPLGRLLSMCNQSTAAELIDQSAEWGADVSVVVEMAKTSPTLKDLELTVPPRKRRDDAFFQNVVTLFESVRRMSLNPAVQIAEANHVPVSTVHGWLREAKRRGLMPRPSRKGQSDGSINEQAGETELDRSQVPPVPP